MSKSSRRIMRTTAAVIGMSAIGALGSGTAFADTVPALDGAPDAGGATGATDLTGAQDGLGAVQEVGGTDLHSFELPSVADQSVHSAYLARRHHGGHRGHGHGHGHQRRHHHHR
jgi:hypothetical protein